MRLLDRISLPSIAKSNPISFWVAIVLHMAIIVGLVFTGFQSWEIPQKELKNSISKSTPKIVAVNPEVYKKATQRILDIQKKKELKTQREERHLRQLEDERYKKQKKINRLKESTKKEEKAKAKAEKSRKAAEKKNKQALKKKKLAEKKALEAEKRKKTAEKKAKAAEKEKKKIEKLRKVEANKFEKQDTRSLKKEIQAEEDQEREIAQEDILNELKANYVNQIASRVKEKWRYQGAQDDWGCDVYILQDLNGNVQSVNLQSCNVSNSVKAKVFKDAIERAVYKASPLPHAPDKSVFDREILFHFRVN